MGEQAPGQGRASHRFRAGRRAIEALQRRIGRVIGAKGLFGPVHAVQGVAEYGQGHAALVWRKRAVIEQRAQSRLSGCGLAAGDLGHGQGDAGRGVARRQFQRPLGKVPRRRRLAALGGYCGKPAQGLQIDGVDGEGPLVGGAGAGAVARGLQRPAAVAVGRCVAAIERDGGVQRRQSFGKPPRPRQARAQGAQGREIVRRHGQGGPEVLDRLAKPSPTLLAHRPQLEEQGMGPTEGQGGVRQARGPFEVARAHGGHDLLQTAGKGGVGGWIGHGGGPSAEYSALAVIMADISSRSAAVRCGFQTSMISMTRV